MSISATMPSRRALLQALGAAGLGVVTLPLLRRPASAAAGDLTYYTWSGYEVPELHQPFSAEFGKPPQVSIFASEAEALQKVLAGFTPDVSHPCIYDLGRWRDAGAIKPIDTARLAHWGDLFDELKQVSDPGDGKTWLVPFDWGNGSILYRSDLVDIKEESWSLLWDERYAGKLAMWDAIDGAVNAAALVSGAKNPFDMTDAELATVKELLVKQRSLLRFYWNDPTEAEQALASGEVVAAYTWNQGLVNLRKQGLPVKYMLPKEGILTWVCGLVIMANGPADEDTAYAFLNSMLDSAQTGHYLIDGYGYGHSNRKSFETVSAARLEELGLPPRPSDMFKHSVVLGIMKPAVREKYIRMFEEIKAMG